MNGSERDRTADLRFRKAYPASNSDAFCLTPRAEGDDSQRAGPPLPHNQPTTAFRLVRALGVGVRA